jgi:hypothetical protein
LIDLRERFAEPAVGDETPRRAPQGRKQHLKIENTSKRNLNKNGPFIYELLHGILSSRFLPFHL